MYESVSPARVVEMSGMTGGSFAPTLPLPSSVPQAQSAATSGWSQRTRSLLGVQVVGTGSYLPDNIVTNADLQARYGFDPAWIEQRTGIRERRHALPEQATSDLCIEAAKNAIRSAHVDTRDIDLVVVGTFTPDYQCPTTANLVQAALGLDCPALDVQAACSGFVYAP